MAVLLEPSFVNRAVELAEFDALVEQLARGRRRHVALLGLRRIGKTMLLDEVRRRHARVAIAYLALDEVVSTPEDFARAFTVETLRAAATRIGCTGPVGETDDELRQAAQTLSAQVVGHVERIIARLRGESSYGALLTAVMRLPSVISEALDLPLLVMLDEFQDVVRLRAFAGTDNLLGTIRAALDRRGRVGYVVAGSRVSAMRKLLGDGESPLFTRFEPLELRPFASEATHELATGLWDEEGLVSEPDASERLHRLSGGWPFYVQAVAARAGQLARAAHGRITADVVDLAFQHELLGRAALLGQQCRYLLETALRTDAEDLRNVIETVLRQVARWQPVSRTNVARRLGRHHAPAQVYRAANRLIDTDFLQEAEGQLTLLDPVFRLWLLLEPARRDPDAALGNPDALRRMLRWFEAQHAQDREQMGTLFERRVENVVRQFGGQTVDGRLFGLEGPITLPDVSTAARIRVEDPEGRFRQGPDSYEVDLATAGKGPADTWAVEVKHRRGAITRAMVDRFLTSARAISAAHNITFARLWMVAPRGVRPDALELARRGGVAVSGLRQLDRLEQVLATSMRLPTA
jgi:hypothetical protein